MDKITEARIEDNTGKLIFICNGKEYKLSLEDTYRICESYTSESPDKLKMTSVVFHESGRIPLQLKKPINKTEGFDLIMKCLEEVHCEHFI